MDLDRLRREGSNIKVDLDLPPSEEIPDWLDRDKLGRGQEFFQRHSAAIFLSLHCSLTVGFVVDRLLNVLVMNRASDTPRKAIRRYLETLVHVYLWHTTDIFDSSTPSSGYQSLKFVRAMHHRVDEALAMAADDGHQVTWL